MDNNVNEQLPKELKLPWYLKTTKLIAYDFEFENIDNLMGFVRDILISESVKFYHPDIIIHKAFHVRIEIYNKSKGGFKSEEIEYAKSIETIYLEKYRNE